MEKEDFMFHMFISHVKLFYTKYISVHLHDLNNSFFSAFHLKKN